MSMHLMNEIDKLKRNILSLSAMVEESVRKAVTAIETRDPRLAKSIIEYDSEIDRREVDVEEECLKILALHHPVASDLRFIVAVLKIDSDLERIGDLAVNIAKRAFALAQYEKPDYTFDFPAMAQKSLLMLKMALDSLVNLDVELARKVGDADDEVDIMKKEITAKVKEAIGKQPSQAEQYLQFMSIARHLERVADHAANIAEYVVYMIDGEIVRHKMSEIKRSAK